MTTGRLVIVTGTDTGIGKTTVTRGLARALANRGEDVLPLKWIETGCREDDDGRLIGEDASALARAARREADVERIGPVRFRLPAAPPVAARNEGVVLDRDALRRARDEALASARWVLLEGAGGALVPVTDDDLFVDLSVKEVENAAFVLVTRDGLGTVHQTLATHEALARRGCRVLAVMVNQRSIAEANDRSESIATLKRWLGAELVLGPIAPSPNATDDDLAASVEATGLIERILAL